MDALACCVFLTESFVMWGIIWKGPALRAGQWHWLTRDMNWQNKSNSVSKAAVWKRDSNGRTVSALSKPVRHEALKHASRTCVKRKQRCPVKGQLYIMFVWAGAKMRSHIKSLLVWYQHQYTTCHPASKPAQWYRAIISLKSNYPAIGKRCRAFGLFEASALTVIDDAVWRASARSGR